MCHFDYSAQINGAMAEARLNFSHFIPDRVVKIYAE